MSTSLKTDQRTDVRQTLTDARVAVVDVESGVEFEAQAADLSRRGLKFVAPLEPVVGADMHVRVSGERSLTASLQVTRVSRGEQGFEVAGRLSRVA